MKNKMLVRLGKSVLGIALFMGLAIGTVSAQAVNPNALKAFQTSSGGATAQWGAGPNGSWEATWVKEGQKLVYCYDQAGVLQQKKIFSTLSSFPASISASVNAAYPSAKVQGAYKVVDRSNQKFYEVQVANANNVDRMRYSLEGKILGKTTVASTQPAASTLTASAATPAPKPATPAATSKPATTNSNPAMAMRGEAASTTTTTKAATNTVKNDDLIDDDLGDLLEDDDDLGDLMDDDENWDDINLDDDIDDDSDLLDGTDDLDDDLDLDDDIEDDDDGI